MSVGLNLKVRPPFLSLRWLQALILCCCLQNLSLLFPLLSITWTQALIFCHLNYYISLPGRVSPGTPTSLSPHFAAGWTAQIKTMIICLLPERRQILPRRCILCFYLDFQPGKNSQFITLCLSEDGYRLYFSKEVLWQIIFIKDPDLGVYQSLRKTSYPTGLFLFVSILTFLSKKPGVHRPCIPHASWLSTLSLPLSFPLNIYVTSMLHYVTLTSMLNIMYNMCTVISENKGRRKPPDKRDHGRDWLP